MTSISLTDVAVHGRDTRSADSGRTPGGGNQLAWQREMEKAHASSWFPQRPTDESPGLIRPQRGSVQTRMNQMDEHRRHDPRRPEPTAFPPPPALPSARVVTDVPSLPGPSYASPPPAPATTLVPRATRGTAASVPIEKLPATPIAEAATVLPYEPGAAGPFAVRDPLAMPVNFRFKAPGAAAADSDTVENGVDVPAATRTGGQPGEAPAQCSPVRMHIEWQGSRADVWLGVDSALAEQVPQLAAAVAQAIRRRGDVLGGLVCNGKPWGAADRHPAQAPSRDSHARQLPVEGTEPLTHPIQGATP